MKRSRAPKAPDPFDTAQAEAQFNRTDTFAPGGGGVRHGYTDPVTGEFRSGVAPRGAQSAQTYEESPTEAAIRAMLEPASVDLVGRVLADNLQGMPGPARAQDRSSVAQSIFDRTLSMMMPGIDRSNERIVANLQNRGIPMGSEAWNDTYGEQQRRTEDTIQRLALDADVAAGAEQSRQFGIDQAQRRDAMSELVAAMGGGYNPASNMPSGTATTVNYSAMVGQKHSADMANWQQQQQQQMQTAQTLGSLGAMMIKSHSSTKDVVGHLDLTRVAAAVQSLDVKAWRYREGQGPDQEVHIGPMAEDFYRATSVGNDQEISVIDYLGVLLGALQSALGRIDALESQLAGGELH